MKNYLIYFFILFFACGKSDVTDDSRYGNTIIGDWFQIDTSYLRVTNPLSNITTEIKYNELYSIKSNGRFELNSNSLFQICDDGQYQYDFDTSCAYFSCDTVKVLLNGQNVNFENDNKKLKWSDIKFNGDTLFANVQYLDKLSGTYTTGVKRRYLKK